jgi:hypothetical protein
MNRFIKAQTKKMTKQFWSWFCGMAFRAAVVLLLMSSMSSKWLPFNISFNLKFVINKIQKGKCYDHETLKIETYPTLNTVPFRL